MRSAVEQRYEAAVAQSTNPQVVAASDARYIWASEAKVACGIAIGYLKTRTVDEENINKCDEFARRMMIVPPPPTPPPPRPAVPLPPRPVAPAPPPACTIQLPQSIYFAFDVDAPPPEAREITNRMAQSMAACGWTGLTVTGHADRSGSDSYNQALSQRRANNVASLLSGAGVASSAIVVDAKGESAPAVPTPDGVKEPQNRRVEVTATSRR